MQSFAEFAAFLKHGREQQWPGRPLCNNTRVYAEGECGLSPTAISIRHHRTDIVTFRDDGVIFVDPNGFFTRSTLDRLNEYTPFRIYSWRCFPSEEPAFVIDTTSAPGNWRRGVWLLAEPGPGACALTPDRRVSPWSPDKGDRSGKLMSAEQYRSLVYHQRGLAAKAKQRQRELARQFRKALKKLERVMPRRAISGLFPDVKHALDAYSTARDVLVSRTEEVQQLRLNVERKAAQLALELAEQKRINATLADQLSTAIESWKPPPAERQRVIQLE